MFYPPIGLVEMTFLLIEAKLAIADLGRGTMALHVIWKIQEKIKQIYYKIKLMKNLKNK